MPMSLNATVGGNSPASAGAQPLNQRVGPTGEPVVQELHGRYYETTVRKAVFSGATTAPVTTSAGFATTLTGFCLTNPISSNVNLVVNKISWAELVAQTAALTLGIQTGYNTATAVTQTTPLVPLSNFVGQPAGVGLIASAVTLPTAPTRLILLGSLVTGAITTQIGGGNVVDLEGSLIIPPGGYAAFYTSAASVASSLAFGMQWEEVSTII